MLEFLFDDTWIEYTSGLRRVLAAPEKVTSPVLQSEMPWESEGIHGFHTVLWDEEEDRFKLWYRASAPGITPLQRPDDPSVETSEREQIESRHFLCYAESQDGLSWLRPELGRHSFQGSKANNIIQPIAGRSVVFGNIQKDVSDPDPGRRYKAFEFEHNPADSLPQRYADGHGVCVAYSPDGFSWTQPKLVMGTTEMTDADYLLPGRDPHTGKWVAFMRPRTHPKRRFIGYSESDDFEHWSYPRMLLTPDRGDSDFIEFYGLTAAYIEPFYVGLLWVFHNNPDYSPMTNELVYSRNGQQWQRAMPGAEYLPLGPTGSFDCRMINPIGIVRRGDELLIFYNASNHDHGSDRGQPMSKGKVDPGQVRRRSIGLARVPRGKFCGYEAPYEGMLETKYLTNYTGDGPRLLATIHEGGSIQSEILDHYGAVVPGWDRSRSQTVRHEDGTIGFAWGDPGLTGKLDDVSPEGGRIQRVIKLRLFLQKAQVFGFQLG